MAVSGRRGRLVIRRSLGPLPIALTAGVFSFSGVSAVHGAVTSTGNISPNPPVSGQSITIGQTALGILMVDADSDFTSHAVTIGSGVSALGVAKVSGAGSTWTSSSSLRVGFFGKGALNIAEGGRFNTEASFPSDLGYGAG
jgi:T5SS/PEP-CTERM-associated repeat protein